MKKLMIAAAVVASAIAVHAASFTWSTGYLEGLCLPGSDTSAMVKNYLMYSASGSTQADLLSAVRGASNKGTALSTFYTNNGLSDATPNDDGDIDQTAFTTDRVATGDTLSAYIAALLVDGDNTYLFLSEIQSGKAQTASAPGLVYNEYDASSAAAFDTKTAFENAGWYDVTSEQPGPEPTPEPTSAMLMLLGMAGLALRRKQK